MPSSKCLKRWVYIPFITCSPCAYLNRISCPSYNSICDNDNLEDLLKNNVRLEVRLEVVP